MGKKDGGMKGDASKQKNVTKRGPGAHSGRSFGEAHRNGVRRTSADGKNLLAPRSLRKKGRALVQDCTKKELEKAGCGDEDVRRGKE